MKRAIEIIEAKIKKLEARIESIEKTCIGRVATGLKLARIEKIEFTIVHLEKLIDEMKEEINNHA